MESTRPSLKHHFFEHQTDLNMFIFWLPKVEHRTLKYVVRPITRVRIQLHQESLTKISYCALWSGGRGMMCFEIGGEKLKEFFVEKEQRQRKVADGNRR